MLAKTYPYYLANRPVAPNHDLEVRDKFSGEVATRVAQADARALDEAIASAAAAAEPMRRLAAYERQNVLQHLVDRCRERLEDPLVDLADRRTVVRRLERGEVPVCERLQRRREGEPLGEGLVERRQHVLRDLRADHRKERRRRHRDPEP